MEGVLTSCMEYGVFSYSSQELEGWVFIAARRVSCVSVGFHVL